MSPSRAPGQRVVIVAPTAADAEAIGSALAADGLTTVPLSDLDGLPGLVLEEAGALVVAQEALSEDGSRALRELLSRQPAWSDLPLIVLTFADEAAHESARALALFGPAANLTLLERPCTPATLLSAVRVALKARARQIRTRDLLESLDERTRQLSRSNADLEQFAYATSHDLQEPLRMVANYLGLLERRLGDRLDDRSREFLAFAVDGATRMKGMIDAVLQYARIEKDGDQLAELDAREAVDDALRALRSEIEGAGARIEVGQLPRVVADRSLLARVFQNLVSNAIKFRAAAPPTVAIAAEPREREWEFSVSDRGLGIAPDQQGRLFRLFQRLHAGPAHGSGIGLATCRRIVERRGGRIWVDSVPGEGSTFRFTIPHERTATGVVARRDASHASIILVDDNPGDIQLLQEVFREHAAEVDVAGTVGGAALIDHLSRRDPSRLPAVVLIDLNMPEMDGREVLSFLKGHPVYRAIPAVMYTSSMRQSERQQCLQLGADDYIVKPTSLKDCEGVVLRIRELLRANVAG